MNKTESVSIGRKAFVFERDAYEIVSAYLLRAKKRLSGDPDSDEILSDLELAMAGHLADLCGDLVVDKKSAEDVIKILGEVEVVADQEESGNDDASDDQSGFFERFKSLFSKGLKKDHSREIISGVCAGIAKRLMIDPLWVRLAFVAATVFLDGLGIVVYIVLALALPAYESDGVAKTAGEVVEDVKNRTRIGVGKAVNSYERVLSNIFRQVFRIIMLTFSVTLLLILIALGALWSTLIFFMLTSPNRVVIFGDNPTLLDFAMLVSVGAVILIPIITLVSQIVGSKISKNVRFGVIAGCLWILSLLTAVGSSVNVVPNAYSRLISNPPSTENLLVEVTSKRIVHSCLSLWGDCKASEPIIRTESICGVDVPVADRSELTNLYNRSWGSSWHTFEYPVTQEKYCDFVRGLTRDYNFDEVVLINQPLNDKQFIGWGCQDSYGNWMYVNVDDAGNPVLESHDKAGAKIIKIWRADYFVRVPLR